MGGKFWDEAWSLVEGCTPVSEACDNCWLRSIEHRFGRTWDGQVNFRSDRLDAPLRKRKPTTFAIWSDLYHDGVTDRQIMDALQMMYNGPNAFLYHGTPHTYLIITKRPERAAKLFREHKLSDGIAPLDNIWHIVTAENQERADERIPHLLKIPGKRGLIIEPMLGPVDLRRTLCACPWFEDAEKTRHIMGCPFWPIPEQWPIHQVILGPENGPGKRPMEESWAQAVEEQCKAAGVPFYRKDEERGELAWRKG